MATLVACGGGSSSPSLPPQISDLRTTPGYASTGSGNVSVNATVTFSDAQGDMGTLALALVNAAGVAVATATGPASTPGGTVPATLSGTIVVSTTSAGHFTLQVTAVDQHGLRSNSLTSTFDIVPVAGTPPTTTLATAGVFPDRLTVHSGTLYWTNPGVDAAIQQAPVSGGTPTSAARMVGLPSALAFAGADLLWVSGHWWDGNYVRDNPSEYGNDCIHGFADIRRPLVTHAGGVTDPPGAFVYDCVPEGSNPSTTGDLVSDGAWYFYARQTTSGSEVLGGYYGAGGPGTASWPSPVGVVVAMVARHGIVYWMEAPGFLSPAGSHTAIRSCQPATANCNVTVAGGFDTAASTFAVDDTTVYYTTPNYPRQTPPFTETLLAQPLAGGAPVVLAPSISTPIKLVVAGGQIVWIDSHGVNAMPVSGGAMSVLATTTATPIDLVLAGDRAIWSESAGAVHGETGALRAVPVSGGATTTLYQGGDAPRQIAVDPSGKVAWVEGGPIGAAEGFGRIATLQASGADETLATGILNAPVPFVVTDGGILVADKFRIKRVPFDGGLPVTIGASNVAVVDLVADSTSVYWETTDGSVHRAPATGGNVADLATLDSVSVPGPIGLSPDGQIYWVADSTLRRVPTAGGPVAVVSRGAYTAIAFDTTAAFLVTPTTILRQPLSGGAATTLVDIPRATSDVRVVTDGATLYWANSNQLGKVPLAGGAPTPVVIDPSPTQPSLAVDGGHVYWTDWSTDGAPYYVPGSIMAVPK